MIKHGLMIVALLTLSAAPALAQSAEAEAERLLLKATSEAEAALKAGPAPKVAPCPAGTVGAAAVCTTRQVGEPREAMMRVSFKLGSAMLSDASKTHLDAIARVMQKPAFQAQRFQIAGHTSADGDRDANIRLSQARAQAVVSYLVDRGVESQRLRARGFGPDRPLWNASPLEPRNRRVVIERLLEDPATSASR